jgi:transposase
MKRTVKHVGLDVHQATTVAVVREEAGRVIARSVLPTDAAALVEFFRGMRGTVHVALEEGTQAQWLHDLLSPVVARVLVCDRRGEAQRGNKGDQHDADELAELLRRDGLRAVYHGSPERAALRELARTYQNLLEDATRVMQRLKALFRGRGIRTPGRSVYQAEDRSEWLAKLPEMGVRFRAEALYAELEVLLMLRPKAKAAMLGGAAHHPVSGASPRGTAPRDDANAVAVSDQAAAVGLRGLNRNHNPVLKEVLKSAATAATTRRGSLQSFYQAMVARGMREELARVTLARKLAAITLHVWKTGDRYDPAKLTLHAR